MLAVPLVAARQTACLHSKPRCLKMHSNTMHVAAVTRLLRADATQETSKEEIKSFVQFIMTHGDVVRAALNEAAFAASQAASRRTSTAAAEALESVPAAVAAGVAGADSAPAAAAAILAAEVEK